MRYRRPPRQIEDVKSQVKSTLSQRTCLKALMCVMRAKDVRRQVEGCVSTYTDGAKGVKYTYIDMNVKIRGR